MVGMQIKRERERERELIRDLCMCSKTGRDMYRGKDRKISR